MIMTCDVYVNNYDSSSMLAYYMNLDSDELVSEYKAVKECHDILFDGNSNLLNSYMSEFADSIMLIIREAITVRYIAMMETNESSCKIIPFLEK